jgi:hypothetical protein
MTAQADLRYTGYLEHMAVVNDDIEALAEHHHCLYASKL